jgi:caffeoyl-CoA O-methyltransferase
MSWELLDPRLAAHIDGLVPDRHGPMAEMERRATETGFPIIGPAAGHLCYLLARMCGARKVFELGSGFGYSTAWFARAVRENGGGTVHHVVWDAALSRDARGYLEELGYPDLVQYHVGEAVATLRSSDDGPFDIVFNDINKHAYPE